MMPRFQQRLRQEGRDLIELVLLPGLAAVLPWPLCFRLFKLIARWRFPYRAPCEQALREARLRGQVTDDAAWLAARRLITLVDHADHYLARTRSDRWMRRHLTVDGQWPAPGQAAVLCTFHWGAGMWALRHARQSGLKPHALVALDATYFNGRTVLYRYASARIASVAQALGCPTLDVSVSLRPALRALRAQEQVLAAIDVPADQVSASHPITLLGMKARVPRALLRLAVEQQIPVVVHLTGLRMDNGQRFLRIRQFGVHSDVETLIPAVFQELEKAMLENPPAWHFWGESERFFEAGEGLSGTDAQA